MCDNLVITILAAGDGKRMNSDLPKVLHLFNDKPMLVRIIETALSLNPEKIFIITGKHHKLIRETLDKYIDINKLWFVNQTEPMGTGHAIKICLPLYDYNSQVLLLNGDMPLINKDILEKFIHSSSYANILVAKFEQATGYGRIIYNEKNELNEIVEEKDCTDEQRKVTIINSGIYLIHSKLLKDFIPLIENNNAQAEYYLTDIVKIIRKNTDIPIGTYLIDEHENKYISGVNTAAELANLELLG
jgi:UDP-N-acetylglucosamine diphosphorylase/glucosamine-1-phosphate N-acetyltransferase